MFGIHTFRLESIAQGKTSYVDQLQIQGVSNPDLLRKVNTFLCLIFLLHCLFCIYKRKQLKVVFS